MCLMGFLDIYWVFIGALMGSSWIVMGVIGFSSATHGGSGSPSHGKTYDICVPIVLHMGVS